MFGVGWISLERSGLVMLHRVVSHFLAKLSFSLARIYRSTKPEDSFKPLLKAILFSVMGKDNCNACQIKKKFF